MGELIHTFMDWLKSVTGDTDMLASALFLSIVSLSATLLYHLGKRVYAGIKKLIVVEVSLVSESFEYSIFTKFLEDNGYIEKSKILTSMPNWAWGSQRSYKDIKLSMGTGTHILKLKNKFILIRSEVRGKDYDKYQLNIFYLGKPDFFINILRESLRINDMKFRITINDKVITVDKYLYPKPVLDNELSEIVDNILQFPNMEREYKERKIPYTAGLLLAGPPGTGKTSLMRYLMSELGYEVFVVTKASDIEKIPNSGLVLIDELDSIVSDRDNNDQTDVQTVFSEAATIALLKAMDGITPGHNRIVIATVNDISRIDKAFKRRGRFDYVYEFGFMSKELIEKYIETVYDESIKLDFEIKKNYTGSMLEQLTINRNLEEFVNILREENKS